MSARLRFQDILDSRIPVVVGDCDTSTTGVTRMMQWASSFEQRALQYGRWWGTTQLAQFCVTVSCGQACIVLPREVALIEAGSINGVPLGTQNMWGQFIRPHVPSSSGGCGDMSGVGCASPGNLGWRCRCGCGCGIPQLQDEGWVPSFGVTNTSDKIRFYFNPADVGKKIVVQGKNSAGVPVRTSFGGMVQDGEQVTLATTSGQYYTDTTNTWEVGVPYGIFKEVTSYRVLVFAVDTDGNERQIADYAPTETNPVYRKNRLVGAWLRSCCGNPSATLRAIVSLQSVPITQPNEWLLFTNLAAYQDGMLAEKYRENGDIGLADSYFFGNPRVARNRRGVLSSSIGSGAIASLQAELRKQTGDISEVLVRRDGVSLVGFV